MSKIDPENSAYATGYTVAYSEDMANARVYGVGGAGIVLLITGVWQGIFIAVLLGLGLLLFAAHFLPMIESDRTRIGASQYGAFIEGLGLIAWRDIEEIKHVTIAVRTLTTHELQLKLSHSIPGVLLADWRKLPWYRLLMHLPWRMSDGNVIRIPLDTLSRPPDEIERAFRRMRDFHRSSGGGVRGRAVVKPGHVVPEVKPDAISSGSAGNGASE
ncbi:MAG: hypothetical protein AAFV45_07240 [Pseudomonadota bacterium]